MGNVEICKDGAPISCGLDCLIILKKIIGALIYLVAILEYVAINCIIIFENLSLSLSLSLKWIFLNFIFSIFFSHDYEYWICNLQKHFKWIKN